MFSRALLLAPLLSLAFAQAPPIEGSWNLTNINSHGPLPAAACGEPCFNSGPNNTVSFTIQETDTTCTTTWLPPNKPIDWVFCGNTDSLGSHFSFKFPVGEATSFGSFTPIIQFTWVFSVGPVNGGLTETQVFQGEQLIDDMDCVQGAPGSGAHCTHANVEVVIGS